ncbi:FAD binding domain protein [Myriangium duriaei CBS 260.36]|uniref:FAD binding domain protein n=1 Tax=Myriangium duriaei CBS 260.36 TaxID=1168546 RepID=A0A9P4MEI1_9PEZI|nr:FAD binding domain protein [Myriangium duriaei CBS 260.36]
MRLTTPLLWSSLILPLEALAQQIGQVSSFSEPQHLDIAATLEAKGVNLAALPSLSKLGNIANISESLACSTTCSLLYTLYGSEHVLQPNSSAYSTSAHHYWSNVQADATPSCIYMPSDAKSVSVLVLLARLTSCPFAVKSGGHAAFSGASSITKGITVSLEKMIEVTLQKNDSIASIGPGNTWGNVYIALEKHNLTVVGGRNSDVGMGLVLGGGISFFSNLYGWACDNVASFEIVLACGSIVTASPTQYQDLFYALRGGGNNFGIVTKFNLATVKMPQGLMWGGSKYYLEINFAEVNNAFTQLSRNPEKDPNAGQWVTWVNVNGSKLAIAELWHVTPQSTAAPIFSNYTAIPAILDSTRNWTMSNYTQKIQGDDPDGFRHYFYSMTVKDDADLQNTARDIFYAETNLSGIRDFFISMTWQSITKPQIQQMAKNGGNPLGLTPDDGPLTLILLDCKYSDANDAEAVYKAGSNTLSKIKSEAVSRGLQSDYLYMNYASQYQDVIASYGTANKQRLISIADKYDPTGLFQKLSPGFFKLNHAPVPGTNFFSF